MKKIAAIATVLLIAVLAGFSIWQRTGSRASYSGALEAITLGGLVADSNLLFFTAEDQRFFSANGINFTFKTYSTGLDTIDDLLKGNLDIAGAAEYPIVAKAFAKSDIRIIASMNKAYNEFIIGFTERGIRHISDLKGKKIGLPRGTILEFFLGRFLTLNGMSVRDVTLINVPPGHAADAIASGSIHALVTWEPYASRIQKEFANRTVSWPVQSSQAVHGVLICRNDWLRTHPDVVRRFLSALARAEEYIVQHPDEAKAILKKRYRYADAYVEKIWSENRFSLSLDQPLITALEDEARWMIGNRLVTEKTVPDFLDYIYPDGLKAVKPDAVSIIR
ncbi:MAG: NrtA/SsuA/CpmA family ABC transporter substrate-binding protein [Syntrophus sp. SKADARSKE-3]|nr:NrtA/SsuA/CpmA family ABC transporter substrate-binding protein [Syntrophus sp. SKADARSKE-3]